MHRQAAVNHRFDPDYSSEARKAKVEGTVVLETVVGTDGLARDVRIISRPVGHGLDEEEIKALNGWRFKPATSESKPVPTRSTAKWSYATPVGRQDCARRIALISA